MSIARILALKGAEVFTTTPEQILKEAAAELAQRGIGALVVIDSWGGVAGVISETDILAAIAARGADALNERVESHMGRNFRFLSEHDSVDDAMETMTIERRRHLPVLREGRLVGLISIGDAVKYRIDTIDAERRALHQYIATA
ncbi:MAG TPA: CBS domain-containing protein [Methylocystis sp.]|nr:CBS domain-containing protein [Methylocystis sp.]